MGRCNIAQTIIYQNNKTIDNKDPQPFQLYCETKEQVYLSQQQNEISFLQHLQFRNNTQEDIKNLCISIVSHPSFFQNKQWRIESVKSGEIFTAKKKDIDIIRSFLADCEEPIQATVTTTVTANDHVLLVEEKFVKILPPDMVCKITKKVNLSQQQNEIPFLQYLQFRNNTQEDIKDLSISITSDPGFLQDKLWRVESVKSGEIFTAKKKDVNLIRSFLAECEEAIRATVKITVTADDRVLLTEEKPVKVLPPDMWGGMEHLPELTAAFCRPNDPSVEKILKKAAGILRSSGKNIILNGYQAKDKRKVYTQISSIYSAIAGYRLDYTNPPASFEHDGQRARSPSQILDSGLGTCFDLSLLMAACFEQCGLNPIILFTQGHSFVGCWLVEDDFSTVVVNDPQAIRKREQLKEVVLIETTLLTNPQVPAFKDAAQAGLKHLAEDEMFECAVDVKRARMSHIRPVSEKDDTAIRRMDTAQQTTSDSASVEYLMPQLEDAEDLIDIEIVETQEKPATPEERVEQWKLKLLDLTKRNRLLSCRPGKQTIPIYCPNPAELEDKIAAGERLKLIAMPQLMDGSDPRSHELFEERHGREAKAEYAITALNKKDLLINLEEQDMYGRLIELYRKARHDLEEGGANTLFIVIGFLNWKESETSDKSWKAPLILLPVMLERKSVQSGFRLIMRDEEPLFNPTLLEMLRQDFNLTIPLLESELPTDQSGLDVPKILQTVRRCIRDIKGWEVTEDVVLSTFSFSKYLMWKDLQDNSELLKENPVVKHLIDTPQEPYREQGDFPSVDRLDKDYKPLDTFCPLSADAYQMAAVYAAAEGKDFVLVGPPGTGKSQTISNMIVQLIAMGKTVLFVSEKMAALNVVYHRLRDVGFGDFCLELHSSKANKKSVLGQLGEAWDRANCIAQAGSWEESARKIETLRVRLNEYPARLHREYANGLTPYNALSRIIAEKHQAFIPFSWTQTDQHTRSDLERIRDLMQKLKVAGAEIGVVTKNPFTTIVRGEWSPIWQERFEQIVRGYIGQIKNYAEKQSAVLSALSLQDITLSSKEKHDALAALAKLLSQVNNRPLAFAFSPDLKEIMAGIGQAIAVANEHNNEKIQLSCPYNNDGLELDATHLTETWEKARSLISENSSTDLIRVLDILQLQAPESLNGMLMERLSEAIQKLESAIQHGNAWLSAKSELSQAYKEDGAGIDVETLTADWELAHSAWWPKNLLHRNAVIKTLRDTSENETAPEKEALANDVQSLMKMHSEVQEMNSLSAYVQLCEGGWDGANTDWERISGFTEGLKQALQVLMALKQANTGSDAVPHARVTDDLNHIQSLQAKVAEIAAQEKFGSQLGEIWQCHRSDWKAIQDALIWAGEATACIKKLAGESIDSLLHIRQQLNRLLSEGRDLLYPAGGIDEKLTAFEASYNALNQCDEDLRGHVTIEENPGESDWISAKEESLNGWLKNLPKLRQWCAWKALRDEAVVADLLPLLEAFESDQITATDLPGAFERSYCRWWITRALSEDDVLRNFAGSEHERIIGDFRELDDKYLSLTKTYVKTKLSGNTPSRNASSSQNRGSEWGILNRELEKKGRHKPLRELISQLPNALTHLSPCLLMSPLSIAQYLSASGKKFDVVIFDEASQIPVWDAIGAIARGQQTIVVGDPKQLPPTTFFNRKSDNYETETEITEDLESILDECLAASLPRLQLNWHYRSRHESLITFSNHRYYRGELITFPSTATEDVAISYTHVPNGIYERGSGQVNRAEAEAVIDQTLKWLRNPEFIRNEWSLGIVTFNQKQQMLIEDLLDIERRNDPSLEAHFSSDQLEPVFVKNLENVQGDERDIIIFSLTFGPDRAGKVSMNFGPLNKDGGERRLNVAITRAKHALQVFGTLRPDQIDLSRTHAKGVEDLKHFLEFAERGRSALAEAISIPGGELESGFEEEVAHALKGKGWRIHGQIGVSGYKIDLGVVHPDSPGKYLAGVECDGATYHSSATARDRDKLREQVLRRLGWEILRVWSTDWWVDSQSCLEKLDKALQLALEKDRNAAEELKKAEEEAGSYEDNDNTDDPTRLAEDAAEFLYDTHEVTAPESTAESAPVYRVSNPQEAVGTLNPDAFYDVCESSNIVAMIAHVVKNEGPISLDLLAERIARAYGFKRTGNRILELIKKMAKRQYHLHTENDQIFIWPEGCLPQDYCEFRVSPLGAEPARKVEQICIAEFSALAKYIAETLYPVDDDQHIKAIADKLGFKRATEKMAKRLRLVLGKLEKQKPD